VPFLLAPFTCTCRQTLIQYLYSVGLILDTSSRMQVGACIICINHSINRGSEKSQVSRTASLPVEDQITGCCDMSKMREKEQHVLLLFHVELQCSYISLHS